MRLCKRYGWEGVGKDGKGVRCPAIAEHPSVVSSLGELTGVLGRGEEEEEESGKR